mmetsp:Transcript_2692/g.6408  ORF Transcript_2692/g.6408 Transcript_2692/m.6408 type:complete len:501 (-) Transcript_2692:184-1686(-)
MKKFGLGNLLKANQRDGETNEASSEVTNDADVDEKGETVITDDIEEDSEERKELFDGARKEMRSDNDERNSLNDNNGDEEEESEEAEEEEEDLMKMLEDLEIPDFEMSDSNFGADAVAEPVEDVSTEEEISVDYEEQIRREEVFSKRYRTSKVEAKELQNLAERLRVSTSNFRLTACQNTMYELLFGNHSIVLKRGPISFQNQECELYLLTDGFIAAYKNVNDYNPLESKYETCQFWSEVEFVEVANFGTLKIQMKHGESFQICCSSEGEDLPTWLGAIERVIILNTIHGSKDSTITDVFGWQYQIIHKPAYTAAVMADMKLMGNPRNINGLDDYNQSSPLHYAVQREPCSADIVDALLRGGADPNLPDGDGHSAMYYAERNSLSEIEGILKQYGGSKSKLAEMELRGELFGGVEDANVRLERRREIEQAVKENKAAEAQTKAQATQNIMSQNMNAMIERGEKIQAMDNKAQQLNDEAKAYSKMASQLSNQAKNRKWYQF